MFTVTLASGLYYRYQKNLFFFFSNLEGFRGQETENKKSCQNIFAYKFKKRKRLSTQILFKIKMVNKPLSYLDKHFLIPKKNETKNFTYKFYLTLA